jgi:hypothetical protein
MLGSKIIGTPLAAGRVIVGKARIGGMLKKSIEGLTSEE